VSPKKPHVPKRLTQLSDPSRPIHPTFGLVYNAGTKPARMPGTVAAAEPGTIEGPEN
jgi:hypothetical protein